jgi:hypothetical protein
VRPIVSDDAMHACFVLIWRSSPDQAPHCRTEGEGKQVKTTIDEASVVCLRIRYIVKYLLCCSGVILQ